AKALGEHLAGNPQFGLEPIETHSTAADLAHDQDVPPVADHRGGLGDRAIRITFGHRMTHGAHPLPSAKFPYGSYKFLIGTYTFKEIPDDKRAVAGVLAVLGRHDG